MYGLLWIKHNLRISQPWTEIGLMTELIKKVKKKKQSENACVFSPYICHGGSRRVGFSS